MGATSTQQEEPWVVLFDGDCGLCNATVQFLLDRDREGHLRFAALQSEAARSLLARHGRAVPRELESVLLVEGDHVHERSEAALRIAGRLPFPWPLVRGFVVLPRPLRDAVYRWVARNRYRWFGRAPECRLPTPAWSARFLPEPKGESPRP